MPQATAARRAAPASLPAARSWPPLARYAGWLTPATSAAAAALRISPAPRAGETRPAAAASTDPDHGAEG